MAYRTLVLIGNPRPGSRTRGLADAVVRALGLDPASVPALELGRAVGVSFGPQAATGQPEDPFQPVREARLLIVGTPTYKGTYSGLLKIFLDQFQHHELAGTVAVPVAIAASPAHRVSVAAGLTALLTELGATVPAEPLAILEPQAADLDGAAAAWAAQHGAAVTEALAAPVTP